jgi:hypothetical protein
MPFFSIYEPTSGPLHYLTITLIGLQRGVIIRWSPRDSEWLPQVITLHNLGAFRNARLEGYSLTHPDKIDSNALSAMNGKRKSCP